jgi:hypothetical protein
MSDHIHYINKSGTFVDISFSRLIGVVELSSRIFRIEFLNPDDGNGLSYAHVSSINNREYVMYKDVVYTGKDIIKLKMFIENEYNLKCIENLP